MGVVIFIKIREHTKFQSLRPYGILDFQHALPLDLCKNYYSHLYFAVVYHYFRKFEFPAKTNMHILQFENKKCYNEWTFMNFSPTVLFKS